MFPSSVDLDSLYNERPVSLRVKKDHIAYYLDLITSIPSKNKGTLTPNGFTRMSTMMLQKKIKYYKGIREYLREKGVIEVSPGYSTTARKCSGVRFTSAHMDCDFQRYTLTNEVFLRRVEKRDTIDRELSPHHIGGMYNPYYYYMAPEWCGRQYSEIALQQLGFLTQHLDKITILKEDALHHISNCEQWELGQNERYGIDHTVLARRKYWNRWRLIEEISMSTLR